MPVPGRGVPGHNQYTFNICIRATRDIYKSGTLCYDRPDGITEIALDHHGGNWGHSNGIGALIEQGYDYWRGPIADHTWGRSGKPAKWIQRKLLKGTSGYIAPIRHMVQLVRDKRPLRQRSADQVAGPRTHVAA